MQRRAFLSLFAGASLLALSPIVTTPAIAFPRGGASNGGGGSVLLTTLTMLDTSGSGQSAGTVTPMFGLTFGKGAIPSGSAPSFQIGGTLQPFSWGSQARWSDGSLKFASFMCRLTSAITASGTVSVSVYSGGTAPSPSTTRTLAELLSLTDTTVSIAPPAGFSDGLSGTWVASLHDGINNGTANGYYGGTGHDIIYCDGDAGTVRVVLSDFKQSGSAHGQLVCLHYVQQITAVDGSLAYIRYLPEIQQPYYNNTTPAVAWRSFSTYQIAYGSGPTTINIPLPYSALPVSGITAGSNQITVTGNNYYLGQGWATSDRSATLPVYFSSSGTLDSALNANKTYFLFVPSSGPVFISGVPGPGNSGSSAVKLNGDGTGTMTVSPLFCTVPFGVTPGADNNAEYNFLNVGSVGANASILIQYDWSYLRSTKVIPPYDLTLSIADNPSQIDQAWNPNNFGAPCEFIGVTGNSADIGILNGYSVSYIHNQTTKNRRIVRNIGFGGGSFGKFRNSTPGASFFGWINLNNASYTGLPSSLTNAWWGRAHQQPNQGFSDFAGGATLIWSSPLSDHKSSCSAFAYLLSGEPQFCDHMISEVIGVCLALSGRNPTSPVTTYGISPGTQSQSGARGCAWYNRDCVWLANLAPASFADGTATGTYVRDLRANNAYYQYNVVASSSSSYVQSTGWFSPQPSAYQEFEVGYQSLAMMLSAIACEDSNALSYLTLRANLLNYYNDSLRIEHLLAYFATVTANGSTNAGLGSPITDVSQFGVWLPQFMSSFSWNDTDGTFTVSGAINGYVPTLNDTWFLNSLYASEDSGVLPGGFSKDTVYYVVNPTATTFQLAATKGGSPLVPTSPGTSTGTYLGGWCSNVQTINTDAIEGSGYAPIQLGAANWLQAAGVSTLKTTTHTAIGNLFTASGEGWTTGTFGFTTSY